MTINWKRLKYTYVKTTLFTLFVCLLFLRGYKPFEKTGQNYFHIFINGTQVGTIGNAEVADKLLLAARKNVASQSEGLTFIDADMTMVGEEVLWGKVDDEAAVLTAMEEVLGNSKTESVQPSYTLKVNEYMVNLASIEEVEALLQAAIDKYDLRHQFQVELVHDEEREFNVLTANVVALEEKQAEEENVAFFQAGVETMLSGFGAEAEATQEKDFDDYELGLMSMDFSEEVEIVEHICPKAS